MSFNAGDIQATLDVDRTPFNQGLDQARKSAADFTKDPITATLALDSKQATSDLTKWRSDQTKKALTLNLAVATANATKALNTWRSDQQKKNLELSLGLDTDDATEQLEEWKSDQENLDLEVEVDTSEADDHLEEWRADQNLNMVNIDVDVDTVDASIHMDDWRAEEEAQRVHQDVDVDTDEAQSNLNNMRDSANGAAGGMGLLMTAIIPLASLAVPILAVASGGVLAFGAAILGAAAGAGILAAIAIPAFKGIATQNKAVAAAETKLAAAQKQVDSAKTTSQKATATANLATARKNLAVANAAVTPTEKKLSDALTQAKSAWNLWSVAQEPKVLPIVAQILKLVGPLLNSVTPLVTAAASAFGDVAAQLVTYLPEIRQFFGTLAQISGPSITGLFGIFANLAVGFSGLLRAFAPLVPVVLDGLSRMTGAFGTWGATLADSSGFQSFVNYLIKNAPAVGRLLLAIAGALINLVRALAPIGPPLVQGLTLIFGVIAKMNPNVLGAIVVAFGALLISIKLVSAATAVWNAITDANPIALIVVAIITLTAAFIYLWQNSASFRDFWIGLWNGIRHVFDAFIGGIETGFNAVVGWFKRWGPLILVAIAPVLLIPILIIKNWGAISRFFVAVGADIMAVLRAVGGAFVVTAGALETAAKAVGGVFQWLWNSVLHPIFDVIGEVFTIAGRIALVLFVGPIVLLIRNVLAPAFTWLYNSVIKPVFGFIQSIFNWLDTTVVAPFVAAFKQWIAQWGAAIHWVYDSAIHPVFNVIGNIFTWLGHNVVQPEIAFIRFWINAMGQTVHWLYDNVIHPVFNAIGSIFKWLSNNVIHPAVVAIHTDLINWGAIFTWLHDHVIKPVGDAIGVVLTNIRKGFDNAVKAIKSIWSTIADIVWTPINWIINTVYDDGIVKIWNALAGVFSKSWEIKPYHIPHFASGGIAGGSGVLPGYSPGTDNLLGMTPVGPIGLSGGEAIMRPEWTRAAGSGYVNAANSAAATGGVGGAASFIAQNGLPGFSLGGVFGDIGSFLSGAGSKIWDGLKTAGSWVANGVGAVTGNIGKLFSMVTGDVSKTPGDSNNFRSLLMQMPAQVIKGAIDKVKSWIGLNGSTATGVGGTIPTAQHLGIINAALSADNIPQAVWSMWQVGLNTLIGRESGWNPNAINRTDINAQEGHPSQGLGQTIPSTFAAFRNKTLPNVITNPVSNIAAVINYIISRYGSIANVQQANANLPPKGYAMGGIPMQVLDSGGFLPQGWSLTGNFTGAPERVPNPRGAVSSADRSVTVIQNFNGSNWSPEEAEAAATRHFTHAMGRL